MVILFVDRRCDHPLERVPLSKAMVYGYVVNRTQLCLVKALLVPLECGGLCGTAHAAPLNSRLEI